MDAVRLEDIFQEVEDELSAGETGSVPVLESQVVPVKTALTLEIIQQVCNKIKSDQSVPAEVQHACESVDKQKLLQGMQFLNGCLVSKRCFPTSDKERAWRNFYTAVADDTTMRQISQTLPSNAGMYLCLETFELLLSNFDKPAFQETGPPIQDAERDIVFYTGGAMLQRLKQRAYRLTNTEQKQLILLCIEKMTTSSVPGDGSLTSLLDRGGLLKLSASSEVVFLELEMIFRTLFSSFENTQLSFVNYFETCCSQTSLMSTFNDQLYSTQVSESVKEKLWKDLVFLYFKTRAHHKCKVYMDDYRLRSHKQKREKGLRARLKKAGHDKK